MTNEHIEEQLEALRQRYLAEPEHRAAIALQARPLKIILEMREGTRRNPAQEPAPQHPAFRHV